MGDISTWAYKRDPLLTFQIDRTIVRTLHQAEFSRASEHSPKFQPLSILPYELLRHALSAANKGVAMFVTAVHIPDFNPHRSNNHLNARRRHRATLTS